ncbi:stalk domain-containing protein [Cohnella herbarum]|uniref:Copper amine oxidase-like N-terminal domain-containing protein n=1 Tax=Cohnella herbarum TaxID=2728023 RepID=A0A7Z2VIV5_9BACL|nr:stalk domain-containing protein [Cohnella herbarum]QJD84071.1 hypothetical protein HH215_13325 [Cohnella herbarum]
MRNLSRLSSILLIAVLLVVPVATVAAKENTNDIPKVGVQSIEVLVNARKVNFPDQKPKLENNQVLVPLRFVSDKLGGSLKLKGNEITIFKGDRTIVLVIGEKTATVNGEPVTLGLAATAVNGRTYVPLRFISEAMGEKVEWDKVTKFVWIGSKDIPELKDIVELTDIKPYVKYFVGKEHLMESCFEGCKTATKVYLVSADDLPFTIRGEAYYRFDLAYRESKGTVSIRATTTDKGVMGRPLSYLNPDSIAIYKAASYFTEENVGDFRFHYYRVSTPNTESKNYKIENADYLVITAEYPGLIFVENPFK